MTVSPGSSIMFCSTFFWPEHVLVVELEDRSLPVFLTDDHDVLRVGVLLQAAGQRNRLQHGHLARQRKRARPSMTLPMMYTLRLLISLTMTVAFGLLHEFGRGLHRFARSCIGRQPRGLDVVQQRQRNLAVGPNHDVGRHVLFPPEHDRQHVLGADDVAGRQRHTGSAARRASPAAPAAALAASGATSAALVSARRTETQNERCHDLPFTVFNRAHSVRRSRRYCRYSLNGSWQSCLRRKFRNRL